MNNVNHPAHYNKGIEAIEYIESHNMNFNIGNVVKYVTRAPHKGEELDDLNKALWYLQREVEKKELEQELAQLKEGFDRFDFVNEYMDEEYDVFKIAGFIADFMETDEYKNELASDERALYEEAVKLLRDERSNLMDEIECLEEELQVMRNVNQYLNEELMQCHDEEMEDVKIFY